MKWPDAMRFAAKHAVAATLVVAGMATLSGVSYFVLLAWAVLTDEPLGGPLAFPFMIVLAAATGVTVVSVALFPVTALTEWICRRSDLRTRWQIPIAAAVMGTWVLMLAATATLLSGAPLASGAAPAGVIVLLLLIPLWIYWWTTQAADWILGAATRWWDNRARRTRSGPSS